MADDPIASFNHPVSENFDFPEYILLKICLIVQSIPLSYEKSRCAEAHLHRSLCTINDFDLGKLIHSLCNQASFIKPLIDLKHNFCL